MRISDWSSDVCSSDLMRACDQSFERNILVVSFDLYDWLDMTLDQLRIFVAVAEREHVTQAARALNLTQSAVSAARSEEHTPELQSLMRISYAVFCLKKKRKQKKRVRHHKHIQPNTDNRQ